MKMDAGAERRRRRHGVARATRHPPSRLGWLGDGMQMIATALATDNDGNEDSRSVPAANADAAAEASAAASSAAIDLTGDSNEDKSDTEKERNTVLSNEFVFTSSQESHPSFSTRIKRGGLEQANSTTEENNATTNNDDWVCRACTLINSESSYTCKACGEKRRGSRQRRQRQHSKPSSFINKLPKGSKEGPSNKRRATLRASPNDIGTKRLIKKGVQPADTDRKNNSAMWIDKYAPLTSQELCVAPKKVEQVRSFLSSYVDHILQSRRLGQLQSQQKWNNSNNNKSIVTPPETKVMILIGNPGVGKSAMVRTLAREMNIQILSWNDACVEYNANNSHHQREHGVGSDSGYYDTLPYQSQLNSFDEFLTVSGVGIQALDLVGGEADANLEEMAASGVAVALPRRSNGLLHKETKKRKMMTSSSAQRREDFVGSVILVEDIPNLYNAEAALSFRNIMERHIQRSQVPTIFIYSDVQEGNHKPEDLERLFPAHLLSSPLVQIVSIQPVTKSKMKKCLQSMAKAELMGTEGGSFFPSVLSPEDFEDMHLASGGDLRHAIFAMQFRCCSIISSSGKIGSGERSHSTRKDAKLSTFHALGKLLYAKRKQQSSREASVNFNLEESTVFASKPAAANTDNTSKWDDRRGPLEFVPEDVLSRIEMGLGPALSFLSYHSPDFFTDITDLSRSYDLLSDAVIFADRFTGQQSDGPFPDEYAACIGGRAVADANKHPAPPQFRHLSAPKVFDVMRKSRENETKIELLRKRLSMMCRGVGAGQEMTSIHNTIGSAHQFITDSLPYMRSLTPQDINFALANLHSLAKHSTDHAVPKALDDEIFVLLDDDLVDDDDSSKEGR